jgi:uncharacterized protein YjiK
MARRLIRALALLLMAASPPAAAEGALRFIERTKIADHKAGFTEPSGLAHDEQGGFWSVSDDAPAIFGLSAGGEVERSRTHAADAKDLEGVAADPARGRLLAVAEKTAEIVILTLSDGRVARRPLLGLDGFGDVAGAFNGADDGLEGIAVHPETGAVFIVKERNPRLLLELTPELDRIRGVLALTAAIGFADDEADDDQLDVSGLAVDPGRGGLWIVSDTGARAFLLDLKTLTARSWPLFRDDTKNAKRIRDAEGVALSDDGTVLSVVTDRGETSRLYRYAIEID